MFNPNKDVTYANLQGDLIAIINKSNLQALFYITYHNINKPSFYYYLYDIESALTNKRMVLLEDSMISALYPEFVNKVNLYNKVKLHKDTGLKYE